MIKHMMCPLLLTKKTLCYKWNKNKQNHRPSSSEELHFPVLYVVQLAIKHLAEKMSGHFLA